MAGDDGRTHVVYDRHDVLYVYGPLGDVEVFLRGRGFQSGPAHYPNPHVHEYREAFDADEERLLTRHAWVASPLSESDEW